MSKKYFQTFKVMGGRNFPIDMLRHDQCWPIEGMQNIEASLRGEKPKGASYEVTLGRMADGWYAGPTEGRWASFMWPVIRDSIRTDVEGEWQSRWYDEESS